MINKNSITRSWHLNKLDELVKNTKLTKNIYTKINSLHLQLNQVLFFFLFRDAIAVVPNFLKLHFILPMMIKQIHVVLLWYYQAIRMGSFFLSFYAIINRMRMPVPVGEYEVCGGEPLSRVIAFFFVRDSITVHRQRRYIVVWHHLKRNYIRLKKNLF